MQVQRTVAILRVFGSLQSLGGFRFRALSASRQLAAKVNRWATNRENWAMYYKNRFTPFFVLVASMLLFACESPQITLTPIPAKATLITPSPTSTSTPEPVITQPADVIFHNGVILTMEASQPQAQAVAIQGNQILAVGSNTDILALKGPETVMIDLQGKTLMPGFIEGHTHFIQNSWQAGKSIEELMSTLVRFGLTSETEMHGNREFIDTMLAAEQNNQVIVRVNIFAQYNYSYLVNDKTVIDPAWYLDNPPILDPARMVRIPGVKFFVDGAGLPARGCPYDSSPFPSTVTDAWPEVWESCRTPYGDLYLDEAQLTSALQTVQDRGYRASFHVMGDASATITLNAIETVLNGRPNSIYRHQIQHSSLLSPEQVQRYLHLDIITNVPGMFNTCDADTYLPIYGEQYYQWSVNRYTLADLGAHVSAIGDWLGGDVNLLNPFRRLYGLVTMQQWPIGGNVCEPPQWIAEHKIGVARALEMLTIEPAYTVSMEDYIGSIRPGKYADLIIISDNPLTVDPDQLIDLQVWMTMINGKVVYCAAGGEKFCPSTVASKTSAIPIGFIDVPVPNQTISGKIEIAGWALDEIKIDRVEIYLDGQFIGNATYGNPRPDVEHDYPGRPGTPDFGFIFILDTTSYSNGSHTIEALAINSSGNKGSLIPNELTITIHN